MSDSKNLLDIKFALSQLSGNSDLLYKMLQKFSVEFIAIPEKVKNALAQNDLSEAKLQVHTTKGLSGNLGLMALYECSKILDQQMRDNEVDEAQIEAFTSIMQDTCEFVKTVDLTRTAPQQFSTPDSSLNNDEKRIFLDRLKHNEFIADETLFTYINSLSLNEEQKILLKDFVEDLEYAKAIDMINQYS
jgi:HPt (histidine-containing phosphotransfer) domain-containing protein